MINIFKKIKQVGSKIEKQQIFNNIKNGKKYTT